MHQRAQRLLLLGQALIVVLGAFFTAVGVNALLASTLVSLTPRSLAEIKPPPKVNEATKPLPTNELLFARDLFNQFAGESAVATDPLTTTDPALEAVTETSAPTAPGAPQQSDLRALLVGTQVASEPRWSLAILRNVDSGTAEDAEYLRIGGVFMEDATIVHIDRDRVYLSRASKGGAIEFLDIESTLMDVNARARAVPKNPEPPKSSAPSPAEPQDNKVSQASAPANSGTVDANAIVAMGSDTFGVPRSMAEAVRSNPKILQDPKYGAPPQIQPVYGGGTVKGFRVLNVQSGSIYSSLGIQTGDTIVDVNGQIVDNPQKALSFFDQLGPGADVAVKINRKGRLKTLTYQLQ